MSEQSVAAVVVAYFPDQGLTGRLELLTGQVERIVIVDNTGGREGRALPQPPGAIACEVIRNAHNLGVGAALNQGVSRAAELGHTHVLLLDQDALVDRDIVAVLLRGFTEANRRPVGIVGANARSPSGREVFPSRTGARPFVESHAVVTAGSLLEVGVFREAGRFREDFFVEGIDVEYCLRLRREGYRVLRSVRPLMTHAAGGGRERVLLGRRVLLTDHAPCRYYLMTRNLMLILREYGCSEPSWTVRSLVNLAKLSVKVALLEDEALQKLGSLARGVRDGALGRLRNKVH